MNKKIIAGSIVTGALFMGLGAGAAWAYEEWLKEQEA